MQRGKNPKGDSVERGTQFTFIKPQHSWYRNEYRNLKLAGVTMGSGLGRNKEDW
jgi:hypothetical protein